MTVGQNNIDIGLEYLKRGSLREAEQSFRKALDFDKSNCYALFYLGVIAFKAQRYDIGLNYIEEALKINPNYPEPYHFLGNEYFTRGNFAQAKLFFEKFYQLMPEIWESNNNLGSVLYSSGEDIPAATRYFEKAYSLSPDNVIVRYNLGRAYIMMREMQKGWEFVESRIDILPHHRLKLPSDRCPKWTGKESLEGKSIYVYYSAESFSYGDTLMFSRYLPLLKDKGAKVLFSVQSPLYNLFCQNNLGAEIFDGVTSTFETMPDFQIPLMSLPCAFNTDENNVPFPNGYLKSDISKREQYKEKYFNSEKLKVGLFWNSSSIENNRTILPEKFQRITSPDEIEFYSFQKNAREDEIQKLGRNGEIVDIGNTFEDFTDTLAAVDCLDLLISADTSIIHIAGALNKKVWTLLPYLPDYRWFTDGSETPWYNSMELIRQTKPSDWESCFELVYNKLLSII